LELLSDLITTLLERTGSTWITEIIATLLNLTETL